MSNGADSWKVKASFGSSLFVPLTFFWCVLMMYWIELFWSFFYAVDIFVCVLLMHFLDSATLRELLSNMLRFHVITHPYATFVLSATNFQSAQNMI